MNILSNMRISDKLGALMGGLVLGFVLIGAAYFLQLNAGNKVRAATESRYQTTQALNQLRDIAWYVQGLEGSANLSGPDIQSRIPGLAAAAKERLSSNTLILAQGTAKNLPADLPNTSKALALGKQLLEALSALSIPAPPEQPASTITATPKPTDTAAVTTAPAVTGTVEVEAAATQTELKSLNSAVLIATQLEQETERLLNTPQLATDLSAGKSQGVSKASFIFTALLFTVAISIALGMYFIYKSIVFPMAHIQRIIKRVNEGDESARVGLTTRDELGSLGRAFNLLLDERIKVLQVQSLENDKLNNSIISLIKSLGRIAQRDLTIKVPVSDDITGTVSDAVNLLTKETAKTLSQVKDVSEKVNEVSERLREQSSQVIEVANDERTHVMETSKALELTAKTMHIIAQEAESASEMASQAMGNTKAALNVVTETVTGIRSIRETISETEKRIKRLGERSQEITGIVNLINSIAERTHILALNASMHAASAGEAGKGFAVVAEEVQRLAENAREATDEIASMVNNIRIETSDAVGTMNRLISQVAEGSKLAEQAGQRMEETEVSTQKLVDTVHNISQKSTSQAKFADKVKARATIIRQSTEKTGRELQAQTRHTNDLKEYSQVLMERVNMFSLPDLAFTAEPDLPQAEISPQADVA